MKFFNKFLLIGFFGLSCMLLAASCDKSNSSLALPNMMQYVQSNDWRIDSIIFISTSGDDSILNMGTTPGLVTSSVKFYNNSDTSFVFEDSETPSLAGPDGSTDLFVYNYGKWSLNAAQDSISIYSKSVKATDSTYYSANWRILDTTQSRLVISYIDTVPLTRQTYSKRVIFAKNTFQ
ncbi:hypothetical protein [Rhizosphaericola mali]|uniref:Lipocalin-like domain-containing protein n=1 Tax=Rhizosphaericola mali TaxID=2545455 RepID=A0A5P2G1B2_9BACT|nr:hypothetical protein [Rhizosphaericola mali]QES89596.1 hypothetical protein E0W69_013300 [Rhizosphaericola mali]